MIVLGVFPVSFAWSSGWVRLRVCGTQTPSPRVGGADKTACRLFFGVVGSVHCWVLRERAEGLRLCVGAWRVVSGGAAAGGPHTASRGGFLLFGVLVGVGGLVLVVCGCSLRSV